MEQFWSQTWLNEPQACDLSGVKALHLSEPRLHNGICNIIKGHNA